MWITRADNIWILWYASLVVMLKLEVKPYMETKRLFIFIWKLKIFSKSSPSGVHVWVNFTESSIFMLFKYKVELDVKNALYSVWGWFNKYTFHCKRCSRSRIWRYPQRFRLVDMFTFTALLCYEFIVSVSWDVQYDLIAHIFCWAECIMFFNSNWLYDSL